MTGKDSEERKLNGELRLVEIEESYFISLANLETRFFAITFLFEEACRAAPSRKAKKECQRFLDMFKNKYLMLDLMKSMRNFLLPV